MQLIFLCLKLILSLVVCCALAQEFDGYVVDDDMESAASEEDLAVAETAGKGAGAGAAAAGGAKAAAGAAAAGAAGAKGMVFNVWMILEFWTANRSRGCGS